MALARTALRDIRQSILLGIGWDLALRGIFRRFGTSYLDNAGPLVSGGGDSQRPRVAGDGRARRQITQSDLAARVLLNLGCRHPTARAHGRENGEWRARRPDRVCDVLSCVWANTARRFFREVIDE